MLNDSKIFVGSSAEKKRAYILPEMANRHGLIAGATGSGKTVTLKVIAESFSSIGVPVFLADVKGDLASIAKAGEKTHKIVERLKLCSVEESEYVNSKCPVAVWDIYGKNGIQLRTTISEMGPLLLSGILDLNELQSGILSIIFKIADDNRPLLIDTKDLKALLAYVSENKKELAQDYGNISAASLSVITRAVVALELEGGEQFFGEPALDIKDFFLTGEDGRGIVNILDSKSLINKGRLYSSFLLWLLSELFEVLPEVGDPEKPKMVFFFDEAHLLFKDAPKALLNKIEQVVKLIRSKGVGIYFCTQNPGDIPDGVLAQLGNKIQHALHAYTPSDQKAVRAAAGSFRINPKFDTLNTIMELGTGEAVVSFLDEGGIPSAAEKVTILPPRSALGALNDGEREELIRGFAMYSKYAEAVDNKSAYEDLSEREEKRRIEEENERQEADRSGLLEKEENARKRAVKSVGNSVAGTIGRQLGKSLGAGVGGRFGKTLGGNVGASLARGILGTFFK